MHDLYPGLMLLGPTSVPFHPPIISFNSSTTRYLSANLNQRVENPFIHSLVVNFARIPEYLRLHPRAYDPEWICDYVAEEAT